MNIPWIEQTTHMVIYSPTYQWHQTISTGLSILTVFDLDSNVYNYGDVQIRPYSESVRYIQCEWNFFWMNGSLVEWSGFRTFETW